jgi:hypothetical protein
VEIENAKSNSVIEMVRKKIFLTQLFLLILNKVKLHAAVTAGAA